MTGKTGLSAQFGWAEESSYGARTVPAKFAEIRDESIQLQIERITSQGLRANRKVDRWWVPNRKGAGGQVTLEVVNKGLGQLFKHSLGSIATATPGGATNARDHTATLGALDGKSLTLQVGRPGIAGTIAPFDYVGCKIAEFEFSNEVDGILTCQLTFDALDEVSDTTALGNTTSASAVVSGINTSGLYPGMGVTGAGIPGATTVLSVTANTLTLSANASATASNVTLTFTSPGLATASYPASSPTTFQPLTYVGGLLKIAGTAVDIRNLTIHGANGLKTDRYYVRQNTLKKEPVEETEPRAFDGNFVCDFTDKTLYNNYVNGTEATLSALWRGPLIETVAGAPFYFECEVAASRIRFEGETPTVGGTDVLDQPLGFKVLQPLDESSALSIRYRTDDTTP